MTIYIIQDQGYPTCRVYDIYPCDSHLERIPPDIQEGLTKLGINWTWTERKASALKYCKP